MCSCRTWVQVFSTKRVAFSSQLMCVCAAVFGRRTAVVCCQSRLCWNAWKLYCAARWEAECGCKFLVFVSGTTWMLSFLWYSVANKKTPRGCRWVACSHLLCVCASSHVPWSWHRDARKVTAAGGVRLVCSETGVSLSGSFIIIIIFFFFTHVSSSPFKSSRSVNQCMLHLWQEVPDVAAAPCELSFCLQNGQFAHCAGKCVVVCASSRSVGMHYWPCEPCSRSFKVGLLGSDAGAVACVMPPHSQASVSPHDNSLNSPQTVPLLDMLAQPPPCRRPVRRYITPTAAGGGGGEGGGGGGGGGGLSKGFMSGTPKSKREKSLKTPIKQRFCPTWSSGRIFFYFLI